MMTRGRCDDHNIMFQSNDGTALGPPEISIRKGRGDDPFEYSLGPFIARPRLFNRCLPIPLFSDRMGNLSPFDKSTLIIVFLPKRMDPNK